MSRLESIRKLKAINAVESFDCGQVALNQFLQRHALSNQRASSAQTYVCCGATDPFHLFLVLKDLKTLLGA